jgi:hypothetical protein
MKENSNIIEGNLEKTRMVSGVNSLLSCGSTTPPPTATGSNHGSNAAAVPCVGGIICLLFLTRGVSLSQPFLVWGGLLDRTTALFPPCCQRSAINTIASGASAPTPPVTIVFSRGGSASTTALVGRAAPIQAVTRP